MNWRYWCAVVWAYVEALWLMWGGWQIIYYWQQHRGQPVERALGFTRRIYGGAIEGTTTYERQYLERYASNDKAWQGLVAMGAKMDSWTDTALRR